MTLIYMRSVIKLKEEGNSKLSYFPMCDDSKLLWFFFLTEITEFFWVEQMLPLRLADLIYITLSLWRREWQPTPVFLSGESLGQTQPMGSQRVGRDWVTKTHSSSSSSSLFSFFLLGMLIAHLFFLFVHLKYIFWSTRIKELHFHS